MGEDNKLNPIDPSKPHPMSLFSRYRFIFLVGAVVVVSAVVIINMVMTPVTKVATTPPPAGTLLPMDTAKNMVLEYVDKQDEGDSFLAYLWPDLLGPGDEITSWDIDVATTTLDKQTYLAWIDKDPGNAFFAHPTEFIYIDAANGTYRVEEQEYWPVINGESFEGDKQTLITITEDGDISTSTSQATFGNVAYWNEKLLSGMKDWVAKGASAQSAAHIRIDEDEANAPKGEYYALIVAGYGRNAWVFLEGAHDMYNALKAAGYDDDHITFLGQLPAKLDPNWNRQGDPLFVETDVVDDAASTDHVYKALKGFSKSLTAEDSLFIFIIAHGKRYQVSLGNPTTVRNASIGRRLKGTTGALRSLKFAEKAVEEMEHVCELMIVFDSCRSGTHETALRAAYDDERIKRLAVGHSTTQSTLSWGADYRNPKSERRKAKASLDFVAKRTPVADPNPEDHGGEFSSGFIANINREVFASIYAAGDALDAARMNNMTEPYMWTLGETGPCVVVEEPLTDPPPGPDPPLTDPEPQDEPQDEPEPPAEPEPQEEPKETISAIPYGDTYIPLTEVFPATADECPCPCDEDHWHANTGTARTVDGQVVSEPAESDCGFGKISETPVVQVEVE
jgi:hypothetical protein